MSIPATSINKTLTKKQVARLESLGGSVSANVITATEGQLWQARINSGLRRLLELRGNLSLSAKFP